MTDSLVPHVQWLYMASAGLERANLGPEQEKSIGLESGTLLAVGAQPHWAWHLAQQQAKPICNLEKYVSALQSGSPLPSGIPLQQSCCLHSPSLCQAAPAEDVAPGGSSLPCQRPCLRLKPPVDFPFQSPPQPGSAMGKMMSSFLMEPCLLPVLVEERSGTGLKGSAISSDREASSSYRTMLNNNSFLQPSSAQVPLLQSLEIKKVTNTPSSPTASWPHSRDTGDSCPGSLVTEVVKSRDLVLEQTAVPSLTPAPSSVILGKEQCSWEDAERTHSLREQELAVRLTEAVQQPASQTASCAGFARPVHSSGFGNVGSPCLWEGEWGQHRVAQLAPKGAVALLNLEPGSPGLHSHLSLTDTGAAGVCTEHVSDSAHCSPVAEPPHLAAVSEVVTRMSTIRLEKEETWAQAALPGKLCVTAEQLPLELSHPQDEVEEELLDGLDESCSQEEDEDSDLDASSVTGISSRGSLALVSRNCIKCPAQPDEAQEKVLKPALVCSLFPNVPPTIYFSTRDERVEKLPWEQRKLLRWKMCAVTPNIVKQTVGRSHFRVSTKSNDWLGCWGHHMKSSSFRAIKEHQKLNHFPGSFQIGRKDRLWRNLLKMQARCGKKEFNFFPQSFILPQDIKLLKKAWEEGASRQKWIVKPPASARGIGIQVIHKWSQLPKRRPLLVQRYLHKPYLIGGKKFDLRIYVYVPCYDPLRVYLFQDGLVRFASCKYSSSMKSLSNKFVHLTNYSVNKKNAEYKSNSDETACQGHKWALKALWSYLTQKGVNSEAIWEKIKDIVIKTIIASEPYVNSLLKMYVRRPYCCHELFGFDIMLDENLKPWILEVNISPSLHSSSPLDVSIKGHMIRDLLNLAGFVLPSTASVASGLQTQNGSTCSLGSALKEKPKPASEHFIAEKMKKAYYLTQKIPDQDFYSSVLDTLTPGDVRVLVETEDEYSRRGQFERVFPSHGSMRYLRFFEQPRYFNILLTQWELKYCSNKQKGLELLKNWCVKGYHAGAGTESAQMWSLPKSFLLQKSDVPSNSFSKLELGKLGALLPAAAEDLGRCREPGPAHNLPLNKCTAGAGQKPTGCLSDAALVL